MQMTKHETATKNSQLPAVLSAFCCFSFINSSATSRIMFASSDCHSCHTDTNLVNTNSQQHNIIR